MAEARTPLGKLTQGGIGGRKRGPIHTGRNTKLTPDIAKRICDAVRAGNYASVAARYSGVSEGTLSQWIQRGRGEHPTRSASQVYVDFVRDLDEAEAGSEVAAVLHWRAAMPKDWHSSEKWLKVRQPQRWGETPPDQARSGAFAGVQVNIGVGPGQSSTGTPNSALSAPLQDLLEANPELIAGTMQLLDQLLPVSDDPGPETAEISPEGPVWDAEPGSWRQIDPESDEMD